MSVAMDYSMRFYVVLSRKDGMVKLLERGSAGPDHIRRKSGEQEMIAVRHIAVEDFERLFSMVTNYRGVEILRVWLKDSNWQVSSGARPIVSHIIYLDDMKVYLRERAAQRKAEKVLERARNIRAKAGLKPLKESKRSFSFADRRLA